MINSIKPQVVIMAGGLGTRISSVNSEVPKPMIDINGFPILYYQIQKLKEYQLNDIIIVVGYKYDKIVNYFGDGKKFGVNINYIIEEQPLGTAGAFYYLKDIIKTDSFLLINGDIIFNIDFNKFIDYYYKHNVSACICTHPNSHPYDSSVIDAGYDGVIHHWYGKTEKPKYYKNLVNAGIHILSSDLLKIYDRPEKHNLDNEVLKPLVSQKKVLSYKTSEYIKDMGTPDRYFQVINDINIGIMESKTLEKKQKAVFIDRDGTINKYVGFLKDINEFELLPNVTKAIQLLNNSGYLVIVVTNQPVIARGELTQDELEEIHNKMETLLGNDGAYIDAIYYCPHHPDSGFPGEVKNLKIDCDCRKPKTGMVMKAMQDFNIDIEKSFVIGDSENDLGLANNLNIPCYLVNKDNSILECVERGIYEKSRNIERFNR